MRFFIFLFFLAFPFFVFAQEGATGTGDMETTEGTSLVLQSEVSDVPKCSDVISISGPMQVRLGMAYDYSLIDNNGSVVPFGTFSIIQDDKTEHIETRGTKISYSFANAWIAKIIFSPINSNHYSCIWDIEREIHIFREQIVYIGATRTDVADENVASILREKSVLLEPIFIENSFKIEEHSSIWTSIWNADIVVFSYSDILGLFSDMEKLQRIKENSFAWKKIFIISSYQKGFLSKVLASSVANLGITHISLISNDQFSTLLSQWSYADDRNSSLGETLSYEKNKFTFSLGTFLEYLAYSGVSYTFLGFLLLLSVVALIYNIWKQVIGLDTFSLYYPILLAIIASQLGIKFAIAFVIIAFLSIFLVKVITNKIQLLLNAEKAFLVSIYTLLSFLALWFDNVFSLHIFSTSYFESPMTIIAIFAILFIAERFSDNLNIFSRSGVMQIVRYLSIVFIAFLIFSWKDLQYFLITYPDIIFLIVIANLLVGRYTALQVVEYFRFSPILKNIHEEE